MLELFFEPAITAISVGVGALCVIKGLKLIRDFIFSHLNDGGPWQGPSDLQLKHGA